MFSFRQGDGQRHEQHGRRARTGEDLRDEHILQLNGGVRAQEVPPPSRLVSARRAAGFGALRRRWLCLARVRYAKSNWPSILLEIIPGQFFAIRPRPQIFS